MSLISRAKKELLFRKNLELLREKLPPVARAVEGVKSPLKLVEKGGKLDAIVAGVSVYGGDVFDIAKRQVEQFEKVQPRLFNSCYNPAPPPEYDAIAHRYARTIGERTGALFSLPDINKLGFIPLLIGVGVGFGVHLDMLLEKYRVHNLILVDVPSYFRLSLYYLDFEKLFDYFSKEDRTLHIVLLDNKYADKHPDDAYEPVLRAIQGMNPAVAFFSMFLQHLQYEPPLKVVDWLRKHPMLQQFFYGYFDDELWSLEWTIEKVKKDIPLYYGGSEVPEGSVAFVLGAGPSLDKNIELIRKYKDKVVIVSCGSTITALERAKLKPDIHVELERTKYTYDLLSEVDRDFLKGVVFIAPNTVWTDCFDLFEEAYIFLKAGDAGAYLLKPTSAPEISNISPTVTATGVAVCAHLGFKEIYLFGVDLGTKSSDLHHSKLSNYYNPNSMLSKLKVDFDMEAQGNYGGKVLTNKLFWETAYAIHKTIVSKALKVYNLSDGIKIQDAQPLEPEELRIGNTPPKQVVLDVVRKNFKKDYAEGLRVEAKLEGILHNFNLYSESIATLKARQYHKPESVVVLAKHIQAFLGGLDPVTFNLLFHNTYQWSINLLGYGLALEESERAEFAKFFLDTYTSFLKEAQQSLLALRDKFYST
ncbi:MAG: DUF115 domain-containing protein [Aquificaceae bacterium]|nr:DUF115 domain-containing protein [Aquificaceae bacterium]